MDVQGYLVEKLSGQPFDEFLQERIFGPLGMANTAFNVPADKLDRLARIHGENEDGTLSVQQNGDPTQIQAGPSGGGLYSTALDYLRFSQMVLNGGALDGVRLLAPRSVEMMRTNHLQEQALSTMAPGSGSTSGWSWIRLPPVNHTPRDHSDGTEPPAPGSGSTWLRTSSS